MADPRRPVGVDNGGQHKTGTWVDACDNSAETDGHDPILQRADPRATALAVDRPGIDSGVSPVR